MARVRVTPEMLAKAVADTNWASVDAMTDEDIARQIGEDPDVAPDTSEMSDVAVLAAKLRGTRRRLGLSQPEFAARYHLPLGTVRDWEQGRRYPDAPALAYLKVIDSLPEAVADSLAHTRG